MLYMIKLDWLAMKCYWIRTWFIVGGIIFVGIASELMILPLTSFYMMGYSVNPFAVEEKGKLDNLYLTLPVSRQTVVKARYGLSIIMQIIGLTVGTLFTLLISKLFYGHRIIYLRYFDAEWDKLLLLVSISIFLYAVFNLSTFPLLFKIGYMKGKVLGFYIPVVVFFVVSYLIVFFSESTLLSENELFSQYQWTMAHSVITSFMLLINSVWVLFLSYALSIKLYEKRDF